MSQRLLIYDFGPISNLELHIKDFQVYIGPQASGKSTVAKSIYYFHILKVEILKLVYNYKDEYKDNHIQYITNALRQNFIGLFGTTALTPKMFLQYNYTDQNYLMIKVENDNKYISTEFSDCFLSKIKSIFEIAENYNKIIAQKKSQLSSSIDQSYLDSDRTDFGNAIDLKINEYLAINYNTIFIPAGRSLLSILSKQIQNLDFKNIELSSSNFFTYMLNFRIQYEQSLADIVSLKEKVFGFPIDKEIIQIAHIRINNILKGEYRFQSDGEKLLFGDKSVSIDFSSSGQQESIWILLLIFLLIIEKRNVFLIIEEPEAHLYPVAQKYIIELIALLFNTTENKVLLTTHSPYILGSINNLIYANKIGKKSGDEVEKRINKKLWLDVNKVGAFFVDRGKAENIIDEELGLIQNERIDDASRIINEEFDFLDNLS